MSAFFSFLFEWAFILIKTIGPIGYTNHYELLWDVDTEGFA